MLTKDEIKSLETKILTDYEKTIPFHSEILPTFIKDVSDIGIKEEKILECFKELAEQRQKWWITEKEKLINYIKFPRIYFWLYAMEICIEDNLIFKYIKDIVVKKYFQEENMNELVKEIKNYCKKYEQDFMYSRDENNKWLEPQKNIHDFFKIYYNSKLCPVELFAKIISALWDILLQDDQRESQWHVLTKIKYIINNEQEKQTFLNTIDDEKIKAVIEKIIIEETREQEYKRELKEKEEREQQDTEIKNQPMPIVHIPLPKEMPDEEIMNEIKKYWDGIYFLERATEEQNECVYKFVLSKTGIKLWPTETDEEFIDFVFNTEMLKIGQRQHLPLDYESNLWFISKEESKKMYEDNLKDLSENEIIMNVFNKMHNRINGDENFYDKINKIFFRNEYLIERIIKMPVNQKKEKINLLLAINTKKALSNSWAFFNKDSKALIISEQAFYYAWELLSRDNIEAELRHKEEHHKKLDFSFDSDIIKIGIERENQELYTLIIDKWGKHFPMSLIRKELEEKNKVCIKAILDSENEYAIRFLFACTWYDLIFKNKEYVIFDNENDAWSYYHKSFKDDYQDKNNYNYYVKDYYYYRTLSCILLTDVNLIKTDRFRYDKIYENYLKDLDSLMKQNNALSVKIKKTIDDNLVLNWREEITLDNYKNITTTWRIPSDCLKNTPLWGDIYRYCFLRFFLNGKTFDDSSIFNYPTNERKEFKTLFKKIILEKPFIIPTYTDNNETILREILFDEPNFADFCNKYLHEKKNSDSIIIWNKYWQTIIEDSAKQYEQPKFPEVYLPLEPEYAQYLLNRTDCIFNTGIENMIYNEYKTFLKESRKRKIEAFLKKGDLQNIEAENLIAMSEDQGTNYYAWSDKEINANLLKRSKEENDKLIELLHTQLEPDFMAHVFEKSILWVLKYSGSKLWFDAPYFGMRIFTKSYADRPSVWAKCLVKILKDLENLNVLEEMLLRICFALGVLREPLGGEVPITLQEIAKKQNSDYKDKILVQRNLFNRENFNKGHHKNPARRVFECQEELIRGQNKQFSKYLSEDQSLNFSAKNSSDFCVN